MIIELSNGTRLESRHVKRQPCPVCQVNYETEATVDGERFAMPCGHSLTGQEITVRDVMQAKEQEG